MKRRTLLIAAVASLAATSALADRMPSPANAPPEFAAECASCHIAFPPALLSAADWQRVMAGLDKHYGDDASIDDATRRQIEDFLVRNAGSQRRTAGAGDPPRLTATTGFTRMHHEVPDRLWRDPKVKSRANCAACHSRAEAGSFREREIVMPDGRRWED